PFSNPDSLAPKQLIRPVTEVLQLAATDKDGRFEIRGVGADRYIGIDPVHPSLARRPFLLFTREGLDLKAINQAMNKSLRYPTSFYGATVEHLAEPHQVIEGTVREAGTGKPVVGATIQCDETTMLNRPVTDAQGRFRYSGLHRSKEYRLWVIPPPNTILI